MRVQYPAPPSKVPESSFGKPYDHEIRFVMMPLTPAAQCGAMFQGWRVGLQIRLAEFDSLASCFPLISRTAI